MISKRSEKLLVLCAAWTLDKMDTAILICKPNIKDNRQGIGMKKKHICDGCGYTLCCCQCAPVDEVRVDALVMPCGLSETDTLEDAIKRADSLAGPTSYSGMMTTKKDLRRIVLLVYELRKLQA
jgi:hypothetical protein